MDEQVLAIGDAELKKPSFPFKDKKEELLISTIEFLSTSSVEKLSIPLLLIHVSRTALLFWKAQGGPSCGTTQSEALERRSC